MPLSKAFSILHSEAAATLAHDLFAYGSLQLRATGPARDASVGQVFNLPYAGIGRVG